jgi:excisionase family DNA binding protein
VSRAIGTARWPRGIVTPGADEVRNLRERDKLTVAEVCADLGISRRTFYEWRMKNRAPKCITLPNGSLRIRRSEYQRWLASREEAA